jgi:hypothetical protein
MKLRGISTRRRRAQCCLDGKMQRVSHKIGCCHKVAPASQERKDDSTGDSPASNTYIDPAENTRQPCLRLVGTLCDEFTFLSYGEHPGSKYAQKSVHVSLRLAFVPKNCHAFCRSLFRKHNKIRCIFIFRGFSLLIVVLGIYSRNHPQDKT